MTDEEIADKYAEEYFGKKTELVEVWKLKSCKENFLSGLKAGRPQWHDLEKDPNDLPKEHILVLVMLEYGVPYISFVSTDKRWFCTDYYTGEDKVIAWCEIPTFDKE